MTLRHLRWILTTILKKYNIACRRNISPNTDTMQPKAVRFKKFQDQMINNRNVTNLYKYKVIYNFSCF